MNEFILGQRWMSESELQLGLGTVVEVDHRSVTLTFKTNEERRIYAKETAPLIRVRFSIGDQIQSSDGWSMKVQEIKETGGLITYYGIAMDGSQSHLQEKKLNSVIELDRPKERLFNLQVDADKWFELRYQTLRYLHKLSHSDLRGLIGGRTSLIPHQLYIAHEVANRYAPRVLLADEVGLGKTIEAGMILHHQLITERAKRVLILVPESLVHQWLVEMLRRFNLQFSIYDEDRCLAIEQSSTHDNPFFADQLVLCNIEFLASNLNRFEQALHGDWDLFVVDEAHHLHWSPENVSIEYKLVEALAEITKGVLLLTATPEQLGKESHYARLRLLDPDRFESYTAFIEEEKSYEPIAKAVESLLSDKSVSPTELETLMHTVEEGDNQIWLDTLKNASADESKKHDARRELVDHLLDRHGTGRVLFRNTRAAVSGFPDRKVFSYALPMPENYVKAISERSAEELDAKLLLSPELLYRANSKGQPNWTAFDPRLNWLIDKLQLLATEKVLVIIADSRSAVEIVEAIRVKTGNKVPLFHEGLSIVERDRAAAFFAEQVDGSNVLICSEIGSEGRNFQFSHHLIFLDLPLNPDLLEQRIGRLDRIGQKNTIHIHVPFLENSSQQVMYHWYHEGLSAFEHMCPAGHSVFEQVYSSLIGALRRPYRDDESLALLIQTTQAIHRQCNELLAKGRDRLLEYNSCRQNIAQKLRDDGSLQDSDGRLQKFVENTFDCYGIEVEEYREKSYLARPSDHMQSSHFPHLDPDGTIITFDRTTALINEEIQYLSWDHPMVTGAMELTLNGELGNTAVTAIKESGLKPGLLLLEAIYLLETPSNEQFQASRYLPPTTIRIVIDQDNNDRSGQLTHDLIERVRISINPGVAQTIIKTHGQEIKNLIQENEKKAHSLTPGIIENAHSQSKLILEKEIQRLQALGSINPNVRQEEIEYFRNQLRILTQLLDSAVLRIDALRVIVST